MSAGFILDQRLVDDSLFIGTAEGGQIRLMNEVRWPWLLLIPEYVGISQLHELDAMDAARVLSSSLAIARAMTNAMPDRRINIGALGNVVPQLHLHHVLRHDADPAWPGPVWGYGTREPYASDAAAANCAHWQGILSQLI